MTVANFGTVVPTQLRGFAYTFLGVLWTGLKLDLGKRLSVSWCFGNSVSRKGMSIYGGQAALGQLDEHGARQASLLLVYDEASASRTKGLWYMPNSNLEQDKYMADLMKTDVSRRVYASLYFITDDPPLHSV